LTLNNVKSSTIVLTNITKSGNLQNCIQYVPAS